MSETILTFEASSPKELRNLLSSQSQNTHPPSRFATLAVSGPQVLVRLFQFESIPPKEIRKRLFFEAVEFLSLPVSEIELTFQILASHSTRIRGIYTCLPKKLLQDYLSVFHHAKLVPITITAYLATCLNYFLKEPQTGEGRVCFLDFSKEKTIYLAVVSQKKCELLREIPYENWTEAKAEILQSLRSVCAKSPVKQFDRIYITGEHPPLD